MTAQRPKDLLDRAHFYFEKGNLSKALACYAIVPEDAESERQEADWHEARILTLLGRFDQAARSYSRAATKGAEELRVAVEIEAAGFYKRRGEQAEAIRRYEALVSRDPPPPHLGDILYWLAELLNDSGDKNSIERGLSYLDQAEQRERLVVSDWEIHNTRGYGLTLRGRVEDTELALTEFERALSYGLSIVDIPGNVHNNIGTCHMRRGEHGPALRAFRKAIDAPRSQCDTRGYARFRIGQMLATSDIPGAKRELDVAAREFKEGVRRREISERYGQTYLDLIAAALKDVRLGKQRRVPRGQPLDGSLREAAAESEGRRDQPRHVTFAGPGIGIYVEGGTGHDFVTSQTANDVAAFGALVSDIFARRMALGLSDASLDSLESAVRAIQEQLQHGVGDRSLLRESAKTLRGVIEEAAGNLMATALEPTIAQSWIPAITRAIEVLFG